MARKPTTPDDPTGAADVTQTGATHADGPGADATAADASQDDAAGTGAAQAAAADAQVAAAHAQAAEAVASAARPSPIIDDEGADQAETVESSVNDQVIDSLDVSQVELGDGERLFAEGAIAAVVAQATSAALLNAVSAQQNDQITANAAVAAAVRRILAFSPPPVKGTRS